MHVLYTIANNSTVPYFNWFAERAASSGIRLTFVPLCTQVPLMAEEMAARGFSTHWIRFDPAHRRLGMLRAFPRVAALIARLRPDVVHSHLFDDSVPTLLAARGLRVPVRVITKQDVGFHWRYTPRYVRFDRLNNANATHLHAVSETTGRFIVEKEGADARKVTVIRQGCEPTVVTAARADDIQMLREREALEGRFVVGTVARLIEWKGHQQILAAARRLASVHPQLLFLWAGTGDLAGELQKEINGSGLARNVRLLGWIDRAVMPAFYRCLDAYLHPALGEPFGFAIAEALMNGVPVAATVCGSTEILAHKEDGYLLEPGSVSDIEDAIGYVLSDSGRRARMAERGRALALEHLTAQGSWERHVDLYRDALRQRRPS